MTSLAANYTRTLDDLYAGVLDPIAWTRAIGAVVNSVSGSAALLLGFNPQTGHVFRNENHGYDPQALTEYCANWGAKDIRVAAASQLACGKPMFTDNVIPRRVWTKSEIFNDFLVPTDVPWILAYWLHKAPDRVVAFSIQGTRRRGPFNEADAAFVQPFIPHLGRALEIKDRLETAHIHSAALSQSLNSLNLSVLVLNARGRVLEASAGARALLATDCGIRHGSDGKILLRGEAGRELDGWLARGSPPLTNQDGLLRIARPPKRPLSLLVTQLPRSMAWITHDPPCWMLLVFDPERGLQVSCEVIAIDLGISEREAEIAALLVAGSELRDIASRLRISIHTVRAHVKSIFSKTGISSQRELVKRISTGPAARWSGPVAPGISPHLSG